VRHGKEEEGPAPEAVPVGAGIPGYPVKTPPFSEISLYIHAPPGGNNDPTFITPHPFRPVGSRRGERVDMIDDYHRGWQDAIDAVLEARDWSEVERIEERLRKERLAIIAEGPV
jgi:hypothetical protein